MHNLESGKRLGISMVELILAIAILGVLLAVGLPVIHHTLANQALKADADSIQSSLAQARSLAINGAAMRVVPDVAQAGHASPLEWLEAGLFVKNPTPPAIHHQVTPPIALPTPTPPSSSPADFVLHAHASGAGSGINLGGFPTPPVGPVVGTAGSFMVLSVQNGACQPGLSRVLAGNETVQICYGYPNDGTLNLQSGSIVNLWPGGSTPTLIVFQQNGHLVNSVGGTVLITLANSSQRYDIFVTAQGNISNTIINL